MGHTERQHRGKPENAARKGIGKGYMARKAVFAINWMEVDALVHARHENPHHILGMHECIDDVYINIYQVIFTKYLTFYLLN